MVAFRIAASAAALAALAAGAVADPKPRPAYCTDGGSLQHAVIGRAAVRYCMDTSCWSLEVASGVLSPLPSGSSAPGPGELAVPAPGGEAAPPPEWRTSTYVDTVTICHDAACEPFPLVHAHPGTDGDAVAAAAVSPSGARVIVVRGEQLVREPMTIEIYDRATHRRWSVLRPKQHCVDLLGFAGEAAIVQEWDCVDQGGPRMIVSPAGKLVARVAGYFGHPDPFLHLGGDRWAFVDDGRGTVAIYDVVTGKHVATYELSQNPTVVAANGTLFGIEDSGRITVIGADGRRLARAAPPPCRWDFAAESIGPLHLDLEANAVVARMGPPRARSKPDARQWQRWTYGHGLVVTIQLPAADSNDPPTVVAIDVEAPSRLTSTGRIGIGSTAAELDAAFGSRLLANRSTPTTRVFGSDGISGGWTFTLRDGKVSKIHVSDYDE